MIVPVINFTDFGQLPIYRFRDSPLKCQRRGEEQKGRSETKTGKQEGEQERKGNPENKYLQSVSTFQGMEIDLIHQQESHRSSARLDSPPLSGPTTLGRFCSSHLLRSIFCCAFQHIEEWKATKHRQNDNRLLD
jgi:hypothetical protein